MKGLETTVYFKAGSMQATLASCLEGMIPCSPINLKIRSFNGPVARALGLLRWFSTCIYTFFDVL